ncbi:hypothetical protein SRIMM317S_04965 [Streptomyces rimosus subsp. rimosus]
MEFEADQAAPAEGTLGKGMLWSGPWRLWARSADGGVVDAEACDDEGARAVVEPHSGQSGTDAQRQFLRGEPGAVQHPKWR